MLTTSTFMMSGFGARSSRTSSQISHRISMTPFLLSKLASSHPCARNLHEPSVSNYFKRNLSNTFSRTMSEKNNNVKSKNGPGLIVFDLDYTMWPYHVDSTVSLPFCIKNSTIMDQSNEVIRPFPEAVQVLEFLVKEGYTLAAASRTKRPPDACQLLEMLDWNKYFTYKEIYPGSKLTHFQRFLEQSKLEYTSMLFFDDEDRNIQDVSQLGVKCIFVPNGVNLNLVKESIAKFEENKL